jgi:hypothetical protein
MRQRLLLKFLISTALLILSVPVVASAQIYDRYRDDRGGRYDRVDREEVRDAIVRLDNSSARLENNLDNNSSRTRGRRVLGMFWVTNNDNTVVAEVREFRLSVRQLRRASAGGRDLRNSYEEARLVVDQGTRLDRYLRLRTSRTDVDEELAEMRSNIHVIAEAYGLNRRF